MNITLTITDATSDDLARISAALSGNAPIKTTSPAKEKVALKATPSKIEEAPADDADNAEDDSADGAGSIYTLERVREATQEKIQAGKKAAIKKLFAKYETESVSAMAEEHWDKYMADLKKL